MKTLLMGDRIGGVLFDVQRYRESSLGKFESELGLDESANPRHRLIATIADLVKVVEDMDRVDLDETKAQQMVTEPPVCKNIGRRGPCDCEVCMPPGTEFRSQWARNNPRIVQCAHTSKRTYLLASPFYGQNVSWCINCGAFARDGVWDLLERPANNPRIVETSDIRKLVDEWIRKYGYLGLGLFDLSPEARAVLADCIVQLLTGVWDLPERPANNPRIVRPEPDGTPGPGDYERCTDTAHDLCSQRKVDCGECVPVTRNMTTPEYLEHLDSVDRLDLSVRIANCLHSAGISSIKALRLLSAVDLRTLGFTEKMLCDLATELLTYKEKAR